VKNNSYSIKYIRWIPYLAICLTFGCLSGPTPQNATPWKYGKETGNYQTGDYVSISGNVANFGDAPKAMKPITRESLIPSVPDSASPAPSDSRANPPVQSAVASQSVAKPASTVTSDYDFVVSDVKVAPQSYLPIDSVNAAHDITAFNHGYAPVTVTIGVDPDLTQNLSTDKALPLNTVVPPETVQAFVRFSPKNRSEAFRFSYAYSWSIGDYSARHFCPEHYQFPFGNDIKAYASAGSDANTSPYSRYAVAFSLPTGTPVLASRKGTVVQVKSGNRVDIIHNDSTIATYSHLDKIAAGIVPGKVVTTKDVLGIAGTILHTKEAYVQLVVWRPEPVQSVKLLKTNSAASGIDLVSFPLEFCIADTNTCKVLTKDQPVSRNRRTDSRKQSKKK